MDDVESVFKTRLDELIKINKNKAENINNTVRQSDFHLGARLAFEIALDEFNRVFTSDDNKEVET